MRVKLSREKLQGEFKAKVAELSGQNINLCYQCGKCSAGCPMSADMDLLPNQVMRMVQLGLADDVAECRTIWRCASCLACTVRCPKGVDIARVIEALRLLSLRKNIDHVSPSELAQEEIAELPQIALVSGFRKFTG